MMRSWEERQEKDFTNTKLKLPEYLSYRKILQNYSNIHDSEDMFIEHNKYWLWHIWFVYLNRYSNTKLFKFLWWWWYHWTSINCLHGCSQCDKWQLTSDTKCNLSTGYREQIHELCGYNRAENIQQTRIWL